MNLVLEQGRPIDVTGRLDKEIRTYDLLDELGISYERVDHEEANTMEACQAIDEILYPAVICKNLFLCNTQKTKFYLLLIREDKKFKTKDISKQINSARLSFGSPEYMEEYLDITPGSVSIMGLMNDKENKVQLLVDEDVLNSEYFGCHPCINTSSMRLKTADVFGKFAKAINHDYMVVKLEKVEEYRFYGWEGADVPAVNEPYTSIRNPKHFYDIMSRVWCAETCAPRMRDNWTVNNKTLGQCSITAFLAQDIFGGKVYGILRPGGNYHCYNVIGDCVFDLTSEQFGDEVLCYEDNPEQFREVHFEKEEKRLRYEYIKKEVLKILGINN